VAEDFCIEGIAVEARRATAKKLFRCEELLVNLESRFEADSGVVAFGHFTERLKRHKLEQLRKAIELRTGLIRIWSLTRQREFTKEMGKNNQSTSAFAEASLLCFYSEIPGNCDGSVPNKSQCLGPNQGKSPFKGLNTTRLVGSVPAHCSEANGKIIPPLDGDDSYAPERLAARVAPILPGEADMTGRENSRLLNLPSAGFWATKKNLHSRMFVGTVHNRTFVCSRAIS
jgi:hypothetical protein